MHIGINAHLLARTGTYREAGLSKHIARWSSTCWRWTRPHHWTIFVGQGPAPALAGRFAPGRGARKPGADPAPARAHRLGADVLPFDAARYGLDVLACPVNVRPCAPAPTVVTVHDLVFLRYPERFRRSKRLYLRALTGLSVRQARRVIAVSEAPATTSCELLGVPRRRITVVPNGVDTGPAPRRPPRSGGVPPGHGLPEPDDPLPRHAGAAQEPARANSRLRHDPRGDRAATLVSPGARAGSMTRSSHGARLGWGWRTRCGSPATCRRESALWYNSAAVFVYPSLYEGLACRRWRRWPAGCR